MVIVDAVGNVNTIPLQKVKMQLKKMHQLFIKKLKNGNKKDIKLRIFRLRAMELFAIRPLF